LEEVVSSNILLTTLRVSTDDVLLNLLDESIILRLSSLTTLDLSNCEELAALPEWAFVLPTLTTLCARGCPRLCYWPVRDYQLSSLTTLDLSCTGLLELAESTSILRSLVTLDLRYCVHLKALPESTGDISTLRTIFLRGSWNVGSLPTSVVKRLSEIDCSDFAPFDEEMIEEAEAFLGDEAAMYAEVGYDVGYDIAEDMLRDEEED
jgi:hypothetical protein